MMVLYDEPEVEEQITERVNNDIHRYRLEMQEIIKDIDTGLEEEGMNKLGRKKIMNILKARVLNKNMPLGNLSTIRMNCRLRGLWMEVSHLLCVNYARFGIDRSSRANVRGMILDQAESILTRSEMGREAKQLSSTTQHVEHTVREEKQKAPGILNPARYLNKREK
jgi:hypothetical protein